MTISHAAPRLTASLEVVPFFVKATRVHNNLAATNVIKVTLDFTEIDYLNVAYTVRNDGDGCAVACTLDGVSKFSEVSRADGYFEYNEIDCTALSGTKVLIITTHTNTGGVNNCWLEDLVLYNRGA